MLLCEPPHLFFFSSSPGLNSAASLFKLRLKLKTQTLTCDHLIKFTAAYAWPPDLTNGEFKVGLCHSVWPNTRNSDFQKNETTFFFSLWNQLLCPDHILGCAFLQLFCKAYLWWLKVLRHSAVVVWESVRVLTASWIISRFLVARIISIIMITNIYWVLTTYCANAVLWPSQSLLSQLDAQCTKLGNGCGL